MILQVLISLVVGLILGEIVAEYRQKNLKLAFLLFWLLVWGAVGLVVWFPALTSDLAQILQIGRGMDVVVYLSVVLLFYLNFRFLVRMEKMRREITKIVRKIALHQLDEQTSGKSD
ncbi:DUF2304 domain-containing protein [candidate division WWE3 bacterium CG_4_9_14_3_um_filter_43_9]|uniref:DUF2304 domain-containing protein n=1 Tax=candidate division WWE3 bacterium CG_4_9_14_3_um_filter_43_9 TaxID=1975082 RepID=A0A2M7WXU1_UNCKA|nr:MAG: DUF2304 domain-containing protein [candidate division WWE3 bacterium CG_4_9_14_3_um_filter_43_9]